MATLSLPIALTRVMGIFSPVCSRPVWPRVKVLDQWYGEGPRAVVVPLTLGIDDKLGALQ
jgi:hypothetical protein